MCKYCCKEVYETKDLINNGFPNPRTAIMVCIGKDEINGKPSLVACSPRGIDFIYIRYCPMCGIDLTK